MLNAKEQMFVIKYLNFDEGEDNIGQVYIDLFGKEDGKDDIRTYTAKAKKLIKTKRCQEEIARLQAKDTIDINNQEDLKSFVSKELLRLYTTSATIIPTYDRNGNLQEGKVEFMDSSVVKSSIDMLGRSVGLFKDIVESTEEIINITLDGAKVEEPKKDSKEIEFRQ